MSTRPNDQQLANRHEKMLQVQAVVQNLTQLLETVNLHKSGDEPDTMFGWTGKCGWPKAIPFAIVTGGATLISKFLSAKGYSSVLGYQTDAQGNTIGVWVLASPNMNPNIVKFWKDACDADTQNDQHRNEGIEPGSAADFYRATLADLQDKLNKSFTSALAE